MYVIDTKSGLCPNRTCDAGGRKKKTTNEQCSSLGSMYVFIEFGRLGCKHVIYLGDVYVL